MFQTSACDDCESEAAASRTEEEVGSTREDGDGSGLVCCETEDTLEKTWTVNILTKTLKSSLTV